MPQWAGSCWYYLRYLDPRNDQQFVDPAVERFWMAGGGGGRVGGVDLYIGGVEHAVLHLLYARFWHKVLFDLGHVSTPEPFQRLYNQGYILADAFTDPAGRYVPAAEVVETEDGLFYEGERVRRQLRQDGQEPEELRLAGRDLRVLRRGHAADVRDGHGAARRRPALAARRHRRRLPLPAAAVAQRRRRADRRAAAGGGPAARHRTSCTSSPTRRSPTSPGSSGNCGSTLRPRG